jgi:hypothetical protein
MNYTFRADGSEDILSRRSRKACEQCRRRKQRCYYLSRRSIDAQSCERCLQCSKRKISCRYVHQSIILWTQLDSQPPSLEKRLSAPTVPSHQHYSTEQQSTTANASSLLLPGHGTGGQGGILLQQPLTSRFIGDLCPEARLYSRTRPSSPNSDRERDHLGLWCREPAPDVVAEPKMTAANSLQRYVDVIREFEIPDEIVCEALVTIYFSTIHRFIPLVDEAAFHRDRARSKLSVSLLLAVLLAACRDSRAKPHLWFPDSGLRSSRRPLQTREFAQRIYTHLTSLLKAEAETDRIILIQVHALMSLHCEGPAGNEVASFNLFTAIHYLQVLGMHLPRADETDKSGRVATIFWSIWSLDRLNAAYNGRPTIIHERDMANKAPFTSSASTERKKFAAFIIWLKLTGLLDKTISYYRPVAEPTCTGWEEGFPSFEEVIAAEDREMPAELICEWPNPHDTGQSDS